MNSFVSQLHRQCVLFSVSSSAAWLVSTSFRGLLSYAASHESGQSLVFGFLQCEAFSLVRLSTASLVCTIFCILLSCLASVYFALCLTQICGCTRLWLLSCVQLSLVCVAFSQLWLSLVCGFFLVVAFSQLWLSLVCGFLFRVTPCILLILICGSL